MERPKNIDLPMIAGKTKKFPLQTHFPIFSYYIKRVKILLRLLSLFKKKQTKKLIFSKLSSVFVRVKIMVLLGGVKWWIT